MLFRLLAAAEDAVTLDTTALDLDQSLEAMLAIIEEKTGGAK